MNFTCLSISPIALAHPGIAVATSRAGGVGLLDVEFCRPEALARATENLERLLALAGDRGTIGLRLRADQIASHRSLLERLKTHSHWLVLSGWKLDALQKTLEALPAHPNRRLLLEVITAEDAIALSEQGLNVDGIVARGAESGGWVGEDSAFILTQKLLKMQPYPVYVQGGIGIHTAAACRAVGAAGVVLDDRLWLMPESPFPPEWQTLLKSLSGQETLVLGERLQAPCRVLSRPGFKASAALQQLADRLEAQAEPVESLEQAWQEQAQRFVGWGPPETHAWPMGQDVGLASRFRDRYQTTGKLVQGILNASLEHLKTAEQLHPLQANSPLAHSHRTQYPIVQGPMTRVSNTAAFARAVARGGALPMLALALMRGPQVRALLQETRDLLGDRAWGIGILGFVPQALREEQLAAAMEIKPPFALIAGGRPDQAMHLESQGIATYIHVPTSKLLELFLEQGARRFVFEGRECGGHVGPLSSFNLWESAIATLLERVPSGAESEIHVVFAGGIHDAASAAMVAAMAAPLAERGMRFGVLMGTAYLFTEEAVSCGAIVPEFQNIALTCTHTINLETGPGHASRCAVTPFAREFYKTRRQMMAAKRSPEEIKNTLEDLTLGRLRIASKGVTRNSTGAIVRVDEAQQRKNGMYMIGQAVTLRSQIGTIAELHEDIARGSTEKIAQQASVLAAESAESAAAPADIAIIGIGTLLPRAEEPETFWFNILHKVNAITEIPPHRWDWHLYYDPDRAARDKVYSRWGGFLDEIPFDPLKFGIPPNSLKSIEPIQLLALETVRRALADAGYESGNFDRERTSVILGAGGGIADLGQQYALRSEIPRFVEAPSEQIWDRLPEWTEESFAGILLNVAAGRAANRFDFGGSNYTVDAACASSLAAISLAVKELESGRSNVAIAGGIDTVQSPYAYLCFSKTQALSPKGKARTFDKSADGIVISEGLAIVVLKRLADAERDGDRIYAVIKAVEGSSDGKALGLTAPLPAGQRRALQRTYQRAGFSPETLGLYEAHGTGTVAGDRAEVETITTALATARSRPKTCAIGSVKTLIGHTKCTAGVAGLVKVALALHHKVLPPHPEIENPLDPIADPASPVYLLPEARPWLARPDAPRRGAVSAFGFGGTNFHAVLEEYRGQVCEPTPGAQTWPWELFVMRAENGDALLAEVQQLVKALEEGAEPRLADLAYSYACKAQEQPEQPVGLAMVVKNLPQLQEALNIVLKAIRNHQIDTLPPHIQLRETQNSPSRLAFLFPGQGAQYPDMAREVALYFPEMRQALEFADRQLQESLPQPLSQFIYPCGVYSETERQQAKQQLVDTRIAQPAIGTIEMGLMALMRRLNLEPAMVCGHSYGEYAALHWAGVLSRRDFLNLSAARGRVMATACEASDGAMAAVQATREELQNRLQGVKGVVIANHNAPRQTVISGEKPEVERVVDNLNAAGTMARMLPVAGAFHSALVASARTALSAAIAETTVETPQVPVYANATAQPYPAEDDGIRQQLAEHLISPVNFVGQIEAMYEAGARIFVEVGPKSILTNLTGQILAGKDYQAVALDGRDGLRSFLIALGTLATAAVPFNLTALYEQRDVQRLDLSRLVALTRKPPLSPTACFVQGGGIRPQNAEQGYTGKLPPFNQETAALEKAKRQREKISPPAQSQVESSSRAPHSPSPIPHQPLPSPIQNRDRQNVRAMSSHKPTELRVVPMSHNTMNSNGAGMQPPMTPAPPQGTAEVALAAYQAYQETMRQFLGLQEQVMKQFLGGISSVSAPVPTLPPEPPLRTPLPPASNGSSPSHPDARSDAVPQTEAAMSPSPAPSKPLPDLANGSAAPASPLPEPVAAVSAPAPPPPAKPETGAIDRDALTQILLQLVSDRTGYPVEMLGLEQDIEAELGIDSIKRVEILGSLPKTLPEPLATSIQSQMEELTRVKSLNNLVEQLMALSSPEREEQRLGKS